MTEETGLRVFLAGASGVIGRGLIPRLIEAGHTVGGMTRSPASAATVASLGAEPIVCDVFDREGLIAAVVAFEPDIILNELTDLPKDASLIAAHSELNARIRTEGTRNIIEAARQSGSPKILAQSVAWRLPDGPDARSIIELERLVLAEEGVVMRYGQLYGPDTYNQTAPDGPHLQVAHAAERTIDLLDAPSGIVVIVD